MRFQVGNCVKIKYQDLNSTDVSIIVMIITLLGRSFALKIIDIKEKEGDNPENDSQVITVISENNRTISASNFYFEKEQIVAKYFYNSFQFLNNKAQ